MKNTQNQLNDIGYSIVAFTRPTTDDQLNMLNLRLQNLTKRVVTDYPAIWDDDVDEDEEEFRNGIHFLDVVTTKENARILAGWLKKQSIIEFAKCLRHIKLSPEVFHPFSTNN